MGYISLEAGIPNSGKQAADLNFDSFRGLECTVITIYTKALSTIQRGTSNLESGIHQENLLLL